MRRLGFFRDEDEGKIFSENNKAACYKSMLHSRQNPPTTTRHRRLCFSPRQHQQQQQATGKHATSDLPCNFNLAASPLGLLEELFADNPWRLLLSTILLNRTRRIQVDTIMYMFLTLWPTPEATIEADLNEMTHRIAPLGIKHRRAMGVVQFSKDFLRLVEEKTVQNNSKRHEPEQRTAFIPSVATKRERVMFELTRSDIMNLYHCGEYAADAYQIFIQRDWQIIQPRDHALLAYVEWKRSSAQAAGSRVE